MIFTQVLTETLIRPPHWNAGVWEGYKPVFPTYFISTWHFAGVTDRSCPKAWHSSCMRAFLCAKHPLSHAFIMCLEAVILFIFFTSLHHFQIVDLSSSLFTHCSAFTPSLPQIPMLSLPSNSLSSPPTPFPTDLRLSWTLSQVKFAPAPLGKALSTASTGDFQSLLFLL